MSRKIFLIACEASGDSHTAHLISELRQDEPDLECRGLGGPKMAAAGVTLLEDMTKISALGFGDVIRLYFTFLKIFNRALAEVRAWKPDAVILVDSPAFNLRFAKKIHREFPVLYYISPQLWAWGGRRIGTIKKTISKMLVILPFEKEIYKKAGVPCEFVGHPLLDRIKPTLDRDALRREFKIMPAELAVGLMPGSREKEVKRILPVMLAAAARLKKKMPQTVFFLTKSPNVKTEIYDELVKGYADLGIRKLENNFYGLIHAMDFALVASGTATLETALLGTPYFLLYKTSWSTYILGRHLIRVPFLGIVNILAGKRVVPEFIQQDAKADIIAEEAEKLLRDPKARDQMKKEFLGIREKLGQAGANVRAASAVAYFLNQNAPRRIPDKPAAHN